MSAPERIARVLSGGSDKTRRVAVERRVKHPMYGKYMRRTTRMLVHDENNSSREGDLVAIVEGRPLSRRKSWRLVRVLRRADGSSE
ncbi:MAG: 30S ribosomal protein S17 [Gammaproteobacteria bacterium]|nr:30S ribosomal protein S17 [Gammaproteobacteria bacterium]MCY4164546.1 30S ribosomal protein S17 [Gammaproteobacteria bacterium]MCY4255581.1 30S ribosomal protein S17 [Gammaproteobacteria bacterium]MCY4341660.1 30S ribosomal protein S17 [Gammaproteobacteria bacterium]